MRISNNQNELFILKELGERIRQYRIARDLTQTELANMCGISLSTETRIENGEDTKFSNIIKIMNALNISENLDVLIPEQKPDLKAIFEQKAPRQRASRSNKKDDSLWTWGEDK